MTTLTVSGAWNHMTGIVSVPSAFAGAVTVPGINQIMQTYLAGISAQLPISAYSFENNDVVGSIVPFIAAASLPGTGSFEEFTNVNSGGSVTGASISGPASYSVTGGITDLLVQAPGNDTLRGVGTTTTAIFGANSNVDYTVSNPTAGTIYLAGGANSVSLGYDPFSSGAANAETIYSAGKDTINLYGAGTDYVSVYGRARIEDFSANAYITAEGSATANLFWDSAAAGGTLHFINTSSVPATIHIGSFNGVSAPSRVTVEGGAAGGTYVGGSAGGNSLVGGSGIVNLQGAGDGDFLESSGSATGSTNFLYAGAGNETLVGTAMSANNLFQVGLNQPGQLNAPQASGVVSTMGSGAQTYIFGNVSGGETVYGSTVASATNNIFIDSGTVPAADGGGSVGGGYYNIYNFVNAQIILTNFGNTAGGATVSGMFVDPLDSSVLEIGLSDKTTIFIHGLSSTQLSHGLEVNQNTTTGITYITSTANP